MVEKAATAADDWSRCPRCFVDLQGKVEDRELRVFRVEVCVKETEFLFIYSLSFFRTCSVLHEP